MLQGVSVVLAWLSVAFFILAVVPVAARRLVRGDGSLHGPMCTLRRRHGLIGGVACACILAHGATGIVVAATTHEYSRVSVSAAHMIMLLLIVTAVSGLVARRRGGKAWPLVHRAGTALTLAAVVVHAVAALV